MSHITRVAIIDSGVGGLALLRRIAYLPYDFLYIADNAFMPYGDKTKSQLIERAKYLTQYAIEQFNAECIVFACNTLTVSACEAVKKYYPDKIILGCEPPIKQCLEYTASNVLLLCTPYTAKHFENIVQSNVIVKPLKELATLVESNATDKVIKEYIMHNVDIEGVDCIALGCTHYSHIRHCFEQLFPCVKVFDSIDGALARLRKTVLRPRKKHNSSGSLCFYFTQPQDGLQEFYQEILQR